MTFRQNPLQRLSGNNVSLHQSALREKPKNFHQLSQDEQDVFWMENALLLAQQAEAEGEVPVGALIVKEGRLVSIGWNRSIQYHDPSAHAEIIAMRAAGETLQNYRLLDTTLYVTLEPCPMCTAAMVHARVKRVVFGAFDYKTGAICSTTQLLNLPSHNHQVQVSEGICQEKASALLSRFFKRRRAEKKRLKTQA